MPEIWIGIAEHQVLFLSESAGLLDYVSTRFGGPRSIPSGTIAPDLIVEIIEGFGRPFAGYNVTAESNAQGLLFERADYKIVLSSDHRSAVVYVYDEFALKHALINLYSSFIVHREWGLLVHSSCLLEEGHAYLFAGRSGAGKSTAARLSYPRTILSDEATLVKIKDGCVFAFNSPFRSDTTFVPGDASPYPIEGIHMLRQATYNKRRRMGSPEGFIELLSRVFYWSNQPEETKKIARLCKELVRTVPIYELHFQKNRSFWEEIVHDRVQA